jgi:hypothetical protein
MGYLVAMQSVAETPIFTRQTEKLFTEDEKRELMGSDAGECKIVR